MRLHDGHLVHPQRLVLMEVRFRHAAAIDRDIAAQRRAQAVDHRALRLLYDAGRVDDTAAVDGADDTVDAHPALLD